MGVRYDDQAVFIFPPGAGNVSVIPDAGTSVTVEVSNGLTGEAEWVLDDKSPITTPTPILCGGIKLRLTPDIGGYAFNGGLYERNS